MEYTILIVAGVIILICVLSTKVLYRFGVPSLLIFMGLGMLMGSDGIGGIEFDNFEMAERIATLALVIIIFFGGFGTRWDTAKPTAAKAILMSSFGTVITAFVTGLFCHLIFGVPFLYGLLFGSVVASTDAASVFSILRSRKLNLKHGLAPLLEVESGSNDPVAYMMTILVISVIGAQGESIGFLAMTGEFALQIAIAIAIGVIMSLLSVVLLKRLNLEMDGLYPILLLAIAIVSYSLCAYLGGNGLLCVYIIGIVVGNTKMLHKVTIVHFFDGLSWLMQIMLFFLLGLLSFPSHLPSLIIPGMLISLVIIFIARPVATAAILTWFKVPIKQQLLIAWVGLRGAASLVFAIVAVDAIGRDMPYDLFHLVFFVALFSILAQGTLMPLISKKLGLVDDDDEKNSVEKTFTDSFEEVHSALFEYTVVSGDRLSGKTVVDSDIPDDLLIVMIKRGSEIIRPKGSTLMLENDILVVSGDDFSYFFESSIMSKEL
ncbi:MAG: potassium/proton antiporter [Oscillospiraceae bacterium]|nr:potassium/proton antiporter [Oscillospiraceae bacterium]